MVSEIEPRIHLVGEICVDVYINNAKMVNQPVLGGVMHAARALGAMQIPYNIFYIAPQYLQDHIEYFAGKYGANNIESIGYVSGSPNVILIFNQKETSSQGYELILRDEHHCVYEPKSLSSLEGFGKNSNVLLFNYGSDLSQLIRALDQSNAKLHLDLGQAFNQFDSLSSMERRLNTIIASTSSQNFLSDHNESIDDLLSQMFEFCDDFLFKENRGGARLFKSATPKDALHVGAQTRPIVHSVGVGDCYDAVYISLLDRFDPNEALGYASWISSEYASYKNWESFISKVNKIIETDPSDIIGLQGLRLKWEDRDKINIYIAAPDFDYVDRTQIDNVANCLKYHNFSPRLPIREFGQADINDSIEKKEKLFQQDIRLLDECDILLAVLVEQDDGTMLEIGLASGLNKPVVIYDPNRIASNLFLQNLPEFISSDLDEVLVRVFEIGSRIIND